MPSACLRLTPHYRVCTPGTLSTECASATNQINPVSQGQVSPQALKPFVISALKPFIISVVMKRTPQNIEPLRLGPQNLR